VKVSVNDLVKRGLKPVEARRFVAEIDRIDAGLATADVWMWLARNLLTPDHPFEVHQLLHRLVFTDWDAGDGPAPAWFPENPIASNIGWLMRHTNAKSYRDLHTWSITEHAAFWETCVKRLNVQFKKPPSTVLDLSDGPEYPKWLVDGELNVVDSCFQADDDSAAVVYQAHDGDLQTLSVAQLRALVGRVANGLKGLGLTPGDRVGIDMPMTVESVAIYLGAVAAGCPVVTVADSFAPDEIAVRLEIGEARCVFTQDFGLRRGKKLPLYEKIVAAGAPRAVVLPCRQALDCRLRDGDLAWAGFLPEQTELRTHSCSADTFSAVLFSSGTTGTPKAIPWDQTTPIKAAIDAHLHHDIHPGDVLCWPTNMGWMMGPWLVCASLMNRATMALYYGAPTTREFGRFVQDAGVTMLGLVPSLVSAWKDSNCLAGLDWSQIRTFSSTGECSSPTDMLWLMSRARYKPVIEYCGGTEIGGGYITGTVVQPGAPGTFSTEALGSEMLLLDEQGQASNEGEAFLVPPAMGLSRQLLSRNHHEVYYADCPPGPEGKVLRRHGDRMQRFANGYFRAHGRVDDTMNLGGIKVSSRQIEETVSRTGTVRETAAIAAAPPGGGPGQLVIYAVASDPAGLDRDKLKAAMQALIRTELNPLFKIHDVVPVEALPRTASNKVMRRALRADYENRSRQGTDEVESKGI